MCRFKRVAARTEETYWAWVRRFLRFHRQGEKWRHPSGLGAVEVKAFLTHLAVAGRVAASTEKLGPPHDTKHLTCVAQWESKLHSTN